MCPEGRRGSSPLFPTVRPSDSQEQRVIFVGHFNGDGKLRTNGGLDPAALTPVASLNRVQFAELTGLSLPPEMIGKTAYELLSARALADLALECADAFGLVEGGAERPAMITQRLDQAIVEGAPTARAAADAVARQFGERIGWLLVTLRRGDPASRLARPDWDDSYWRHWANISTVYLGGGVAGGQIGPQLVEHASGTLAAAGMADCSIRLAEWPSLLPLIGAARMAPPETDTMVVLDFGQTLVKRGIAGYQAGDLARLSVLPALPAHTIGLRGSPEALVDGVQRLGVGISETVAEVWRSAGDMESHVIPVILASVASYFRDGQPLARQGGPYAALLDLSENLEDWLSARLSLTLQRPMRVRLLHDGTAAAQAMAGERDAAVITFGTALGVGFPSATLGSRPLTRGFTVKYLPSGG
jgi:hypothetical protein